MIIPFNDDENLAAGHIDDLIGLTTDDLLNDDTIILLTLLIVIIIIY